MSSLQGNFLFSFFKIDEEISDAEEKKWVNSVNYAGRLPLFSKHKQTFYSHVSI